MTSGESLALSKPHSPICSLGSGSHSSPALHSPWLVMLGAPTQPQPVVAPGRWPTLPWLRLRALAHLGGNVAPGWFL